MLNNYVKTYTTLVQTCANFIINVKRDISGSQSQL